MLQFAAMAIPALSEVLKGAGGGSGGARSQSNSSVSAVVSPSITNVIGDGAVSPYSGGSASSNPSVSASEPSWMPAGYSTPYQTRPYGDIDTYPASTLQAARTQAGAGLFDDPLILLALAGGALFLFMGAGK